jgi:hypothetical protein
MANKVKLQAQRQYAATITLTGLDLLASNSVISTKLRKAGFVQVQVSGIGKTRTATGRWNGASTEADLPPQVTHVKPL